MKIKVRVPSGGLFCLLAGTLGVGVCKPLLAAAEHPAGPAHIVTHIVQFRGLSGEEFLNGCAFELSAVVTLVDTNKHLVVVQDSTRMRSRCTFQRRITISQSEK